MKSLAEEPLEPAAGGVERALLILPAVIHRGPLDSILFSQNLLHTVSPQRRIVVEIADELPA